MKSNKFQFSSNDMPSSESLSCQLQSWAMFVSSLVSSYSTVPMLDGLTFTVISSYIKKTDFFSSEARASTSISPGEKFFLGSFIYRLAGGVSLFAS